MGSTGTTASNGASNGSSNGTNGASNGGDETDSSLGLQGGGGGGGRGAVRRTRESSVEGYVLLESRNDAAAGYHRGSWLPCADNQPAFEVAGTGPAMREQSLRDTETVGRLIFKGK